MLSAVEPIKLNNSVHFRKNMYAGGDSQMNGDMPHDGGHGGGGHAVGDELKKTGKYEELNKFIFFKVQDQSTAFNLY